MQPIISAIALVINILLVIKQIRVWKVRCLLSPGFYFGIIWSFGLIGVLILHPVGLLLESYPQYIDELSLYVGFTGLCFYLISSRGRNTINPDSIRINFPKQAFAVLSILLLLAALYELNRTGATGNMSESRYLAHETLESRSTLVNYAFSASIALSILAGYEIMTILNHSGRHSFSVFLLFPLLGNLLMSITLGGRVNIIYSLAYYLIGAAMAFEIEKSIWASLKRYKKQMVVIAIGAVFAISFISYVANQRSTDRSGETSLAEQYIRSLSPVLGAIYGPIDYIVSSYDGYQLRRVDAVDPNNLGYGMYTFNGFINWTLPFAGRFGLEDFSIAKMLDIYYYNQETYDYQRELFYTTHSCYIPIYKDFGFWGSFLCIMLLVFLAHTFFVKIQRYKEIKCVYILYFYLLFLDYWMKSNMYGTLSSSVLQLLYGLLLVDILAAFVSSLRKAK